DIVWTVSDTTVAIHVRDALFEGRKTGVTLVRAVSHSRPSVLDSAVILVSAPVVPTAVRFQETAIDVFLGGAQRTLVVQVLPSQANQDVELFLTDSSKASLVGKVLATKAEGLVSVIARSKVDPGLADTLAVRILPRAIPVERVEVSDRTLTLFRGGSSKTVTATVRPSTAPTQVTWTSLAPTVATVSALGEIKPLGAGSALIIATSLADSIRKDTVTVTVKVDAPRLTVGPDTTVSAGQPVRFTVSAAPQEYGEIVSFKWDLDGNQVYEDSARVLQTVSFTYAKPGEYSAVFHARDTEGNEVKATRKVVVVKGALVAILSPADGTYTNRKVVTVRWSVDGQERESLDTLKVHGANTLSRAAKDAAGKEFIASVTVHWDTVAPPAPVVRATSPTNVQPRWSWSSGNGGSGEFRAQLGSGAFAPNAPTTKDTAFALVEAPVSGTTYTLYVQERDQAGNWSATGSLAVRFDNTRPTLAIVSPQASGTYYTRLATVTLEGTVSGPYRMTAVQYKVDEGAPTAATLTGGQWKITSLPLTSGKQNVITVTATDSMGTTSSATLTVVRDDTPPPMPTFTNQPADVVSSTQATWEWTGAPDPTGSGPSGRFRYSLNGAAFTEGTLLRTPNLTLREGRNEIQVQQQDRAENWSASATHVVRLDTRGPSFAITSPVAGGETYTETSRLSVTLAGTVSDTGIGVKEVACALSGRTNVPRVVASLNGNSWSLSTPFASGSTQVVCTALDNFDRSTQASVTVNVAIPKPVISKLSVRNGMVLNRESFRVTYEVTVDGRTTEEFTDITLKTHQNDFTLRTKALNIAGEQGEMNVTYWYQPNVVFVDPDAKGNSGTSVSAKDGSSWGDAYLTFHEAVLSAKGRSGTMIWLSRGTYAKPEDFFKLPLPKSGAIVGGFLGSTLPKDSALASRSPGSNQAVIQDYYLSLDTLHRSLILDGLHFANANLQAGVREVITSESRLSLKNCTILGLKFPQDYWVIASTYTVHFDMINCSVTNTYLDQEPWRANNWTIDYSAPGTFTAQGTRFEQPVENYIAIIQSFGDDYEMDQVFRFDNSHLLYKLPPNRGNHNFYQIDHRNLRARFEFVNGSTVLGGRNAINTKGTVTGL
ncbi:MAG TPA: PKD domain-containing protein, partial [Fibrobacteria bacterium]|nr:PKD domain-containing protein [Fibrobacteria bacterium]